MARLQSRATRRHRLADGADVAPEAGDGARTHDPQLGKLMLYQLSYAREGRIVAVPGVSTTSRGWLRSEATTAKASRGRYSRPGVSRIGAVTSPGHVRSEQRHQHRHPEARPLHLTVLRIGDPWIAGVRPGRTYNDTVREPVGRLNRSCSWGEGMRFRPDQVSGTLHVSVRRIDGRFPRFPLPVVTCQFSHANGGAVNALTRKARRASGATRGVAAGGSARASPGRMAVPRQRARRPGWRRGPRRGVRT